MELALIVLLTGVVVVFSVLIVLILVVKIYSTIVYTAAQGSKKKNEQASKIAKEKLADETEKTEPVVEIIQSDDDSVPDEVIAVIAAAVSSMYGPKAPKIKKVKRSSVSRSVWGNAGLLENTRPF